VNRDMRDDDLNCSTGSRLQCVTAAPGSRRSVLGCSDVEEDIRLHMFDIIR